MRRNFLWCLRCPMCREIRRARDRAAAERTDAPRDQVRVRESAEPNGGVEALSDEIYALVAVRGMHLELRMTARELREDGRDVRRAERKRCGNAQQPAHVALGGDAV